MDRQRKERLVGAAVILMLAVIFIPMVLDDSVQPEGGISGTNIPARPGDAFSSRVVPLASEAPPAVTPSAPAPQPVVAPPAAADTSGTAADPVPAPAPAAVPDAGTATEKTPPPATATAPAAAPVTSTPAPGAEAGVTAWVVQLGSFASEENANALNRKLRQGGFSSFVEPLQQGGAKVFRVRVGPELRRSAAQSVRDRLKSGMDLDGIVVPYP